MYSSGSVPPIRNTASAAEVNNDICVLRIRDQVAIHCKRLPRQNTAQLIHLPNFETGWAVVKTQCSVRGTATATKLPGQFIQGCPGY